MLKKSVLILKNNKCKKKWKAVSLQESIPRTPAWSRQCSATELQQPDNHQSLCTYIWNHCTVTKFPCRCTWSIHAVYACCVIISNHNRAAIKMYVVTHTASLQISTFSSEVYLHKRRTTTHVSLHVILSATKTLVSSLTPPSHKEKWSGKPGQIQKRYRYPSRDKKKFYRCKGSAT